MIFVRVALRYISAGFQMNISATWMPWPVEKRWIIYRMLFGRIDFKVFEYSFFSDASMIISYNRSSKPVWCFAYECANWKSLRIQHGQWTQLIESVASTHIARSVVLCFKTCRKRRRIAHEDANFPVGLSPSRAHLLGDYISINSSLETKRATEFSAQLLS